jgi:hypothetical protein
VVDAMGPFDLAIEARRARTDVDVPDAEVLKMRVKPRLELRPVVRLNDADTERRPMNYLVGEAYRGGLVARIEDRARSGSSA